MSMLTTELPMLAVKEVVFYFTLSGGRFQLMTLVIDTRNECYNHWAGCLKSPFVHNFHFFQFEREIWTNDFGRKTQGISALTIDLQMLTIKEVPSYFHIHFSFLSQSRGKIWTHNFHNQHMKWVALATKLPMLSIKQAVFYFLKPILLW